MEDNEKRKFYIALLCMGAGLYLLFLIYLLLNNIKVFIVFLLLTIFLGLLGQFLIKWKIQNTKAHSNSKINIKDYVYFLDKAFGSGSSQVKVDTTDSDYNTFLFDRNAFMVNQIEVDIKNKGKSFKYQVSKIGVKTNKDIDIKDVIHSISNKETNFHSLFKGTIISYYDSSISNLDTIIVDNDFRIDIDAFNNHFLADETSTYTIYTRNDELNLDEMASLYGHIREKIITNFGNFSCLVNIKRGRVTIFISGPYYVYESKILCYKLNNFFN